MADLSARDELIDALCEEGAYSGHAANYMADAYKAQVRAETPTAGIDLPTIRTALQRLPETCRYHGERIEPEGSSWVSLRESCCDTGLPAVLRRRAMDVLDRIEDNHG